MARSVCACECVSTSAPTTLAPGKSRRKRHWPRTALSKSHLGDGRNGLFAEVHLLVQCHLLAETADRVVNCCL